MTCPFCGKKVRTVVPKGGDGGGTVFVRHNGEDGERCDGSRALVERVGWS